MPPGLLESAERLLSTSDGIFDRSGGRAFAKQITDGLLIDIQEAVSEVGDAKQPKLSGLARKRLMAWVVVDVLCALQWSCARRYYLRSVEHCQSLALRT